MRSKDDEPKIFYCDFFCQKTSKSERTRKLPLKMQVKKSNLAGNQNKKAADAAYLRLDLI